MKEVREVVGQRPITAEELQEAKDRQTRTLAGRWETGGAVLGSLGEIVTYDLPDDYFATYGERARAVSLDDVKSAVTEVLRPDRHVFVLIGDRAKMEAGVRELNLGPIRHLDADGRPKTTVP